MASGLVMEPVPITSQKHDPAWKHCQMFKSGDRIQLKCIYCSKLFRGGGIHRIKEHLAGQKGNASTCLRVPPDVRALMQQSLDGVVVKKRNRQKLDEEITNITPPLDGEVDSLGIDPRLGGEFDEFEVVVVLKLGLMCSNNVPKARPTMRQVVRYLEGEVALPEAVASPGAYERSKGGGDSSTGGEFEDYVHSYSYPPSSYFEKASTWSCDDGDVDFEAGSSSSPPSVSGKGGAAGYPR